MSHHKVIKRKEKLLIKGVSKTTNWNQEQRGESCKPFSLGDRAVGYFEHEVLAELAALGAGYNSEQIKKLVKKLEAQRKELLKDLLSGINLREGIPHE